MRNRIRFWLMPGLNLFTRRRVRLARHWRSGPRLVLDAGSGNGWFSYLAWRSGARVHGLNYEAAQVEKARAFYNGWRGVPEAELSFRRFNLYDLPSVTDRYDEVICYETLEHIKDDAQICREFFRLLRPGGVLHLCCPFAQHPKWLAEDLDVQEVWGGHVRAGYTMQSYRELLTPVGFEVATFEGMGGRELVKWSDRMFRAQGRAGTAGGLALLAGALPVVARDAAPVEQCYSLYAKAVKPR
jgi:SAM-dependent methyltransferase